MYALFSYVTRWLTASLGYGVPRHLVKHCLSVSLKVFGEGNI